MECNFKTKAVQLKSYSDGSGETGIWTDGLMVSTLDSIRDNITQVKLKAGVTYKVTVVVEEVIS